MRNLFIKTENAREFLAKFEELGRRGAEEACLMVLDGTPGHGKTEMVSWAAVQQDWAFVRAKKSWTPAWMLRELLTELKVLPAATTEKMFNQAVTAIAGRIKTAHGRDEEFALVIDEVDHICRREEMLETLRDLSDLLAVPVVLVGMGKVRHMISRFPQIASRVGKWMEAKPATPACVKALVDGLCEVPVAEDMIALLHRASEGQVREIKEAIANIERFGRRNAGAVVDIKAMAGQVLLNDRKTGQPVLVKA